MPTRVVRAGKDTWAASAKPEANHNAAERLKLLDAEANAYLWLRSPAPFEATVTSATLRVYVAAPSGWSGTKTVTARRIEEKWGAKTLTWNNRPGVIGTGVDVAVTDPVVGQAVEFDVTAHVQAVAAGSPHYGWRIATDSATAHKIFGFRSDYPPQLEVTWSAIPSTPTDLSPVGVVSLSKPYLDFSATDLSNPGDLDAVQVQVDPAADEVSPAFDSGWVSTVESELDLSATAYAGVADAASDQWRVRVRNGDGVESEWSSWVTFSRVDKGTLTVTNPAADPNDVVLEATPPILWTVDYTQTAWRVLILDATDTSLVLADSRWTDGTDTSWTVPGGVLQDDGYYVVEVRSRDDVDRVGSKGDPAYIAASRAFTLADEAGVTAPSSLTATQTGMDPVVTLTWTRATAPDYWTVLRDGENILTEQDPADTLVSGTTHSVKDYGADPLVEHSYEVRAVVNGESSPVSNTATVTPTPAGIWLLDSERDIRVLLFDGSSRDPEVAVADQVGRYSVVGSPEVVAIQTGLGALTGTVTGTLHTFAGQDTKTAEANLALLRARQATSTYRLVFGDENLPVRIFNVTVSPQRTGTATGRIIKAVSFGFDQAAEF